MVGNPARQTGWVSEYGHTLKFNSDRIAICPESGKKYKLVEDKLQSIH
jgi:UDP-2-acetamido-3-amino-2,3-dideoxy-glucuronate N-acetyltransferase